MKAYFGPGSWCICLWLCLFACTDDQSGHAPAPVILSPRDGSLYFTGEAVGLRAEIAYFPGFSHLEVYLNDDFLFETDRQKADTLLAGKEFTAGSYMFRVCALDNAGNFTECRASFEMQDPGQHSRDTESFELEEAKGWSLDGWAKANSSADQDHSSLCSSSGHAVALTSKTYAQAGSLSFYVKNGAGKLEFWIDGELKSRWFDQEGWGYYAYSVSAGTHVFRWVSDSADTYLDRIVFTPGAEQHSLGEIYGGGTIFYLDSTGLHGLIAARQDGKYNGNPEIPWGCYGLDILSGNRAQSKSDGEANTRAIVQDCALEQIAARYCFNLITFQGESIQDDWYLPAINELNTLYKNRAMLDGLGGQYYWSSTSPTNSVARVQNFWDGSHHGAHRNIPNINGPSTAAIHVRPIREF